MKKILISLFLFLNGLAFANPPGTFQPLLSATSVPPVVITAVGSASNTSPSASQNFTGINFGPASSDRYISCGIYFRAVGVETFTSSTIGGIATTVLVSSLNNSDGNTSLGIFVIAPVPTGTSGTVNVTTSGAGLAKYIECWNITGLINAGVTTSTITSTIQNTAFILPSVAAGGGVLALVTNAGGGTYTWSPVTLTENFDFSAGARTFSGASGVYLTPQTSLSITATGSVTGSISSIASISLR